MRRNEYASIADELRGVRLGRRLLRSAWVILLCPMLTTAAAQVGLPASQTVPPASTPEPATAEATPGRHGVAPLVELGWYEGVVGGLQLDAGTVGVRASGGYFPIVLLMSERARPAAALDLRVINSVQANGELLWFFAAPAERSRVGLSVGYHYNTVLKHGVGLAFEGEAGLADGVTLFYTFGLALYWKGNDHAREELGRSDVSFNFPFGAGFQGGGGVGLKFPL